MVSSKKTFFFILFLLLVLGVGYGASQREKTVPSMAFNTSARIEDTDLMLAFASTEEEWVRGLSGQAGLQEGTGLFFLFPESDYHSIWMKEMLFPIDVLWFDEQGAVIFQKEHFEPSSYPEIAFPPSPARAVLELPAGFVAEHGIKIGDVIIFPENLPHLPI